MTTQTKPDHEKVLAVPAEFTFECPGCGDIHDAEFQKQKDGGYECDPSATFVQCGCGHFIEVTGRWRNLP